MEGILFYWIAWMFWIFVMFFMKRSSKKRYFLAISLLLFIITSTKVISIVGFGFSVSSFVLYFSILLILTRYKRKSMYSIFFCAFIVMLVFASFHLYELFDPVWLIFPRVWMMSVLLTTLSIILHTKRSFRYLILLVGTVQGDFLYALIIKKYSFPYTIGSFAFLDIVSLSAVFLFIWNSIEILAEFYSNYYNQSEKEKQKLS